MVQRSQHASGLPLTLAGLLILLEGTAASDPRPSREQHRQCGLPSFLGHTCGRSEDALAFLQTHSLQHTATEEEAAAARRVRGSVRYRQTLRNFGDVQYIANLTVGGQVLGGILDTGSFELVVFAQTCSSCGKAGVYQHKQSPHYREGLLVATHSYGSGNLYSAQAFDHVSIGPIESHRQVFWEVTSASMPLLNMANFAAIVGIGPPTAELPVVGSTPALPLHPEGGATNHTPSLKGTAVVNWREGKEHGEMSLGAALEKTRSEGFLNNMNVNIFSVCLGAKSGSDGYFIWNDANPRLFPQVFHQVDVVGTRSWGVKLTGARLAHSLFKVNLGCTESCGAIIDSGTSLLVVPPVAVDQISRAVESLDADCSNLDVLPTLVFNLGGREYSLPPSSYVGDEGNLPGYLRPSWSKGHKVVHKCKLLLMETDTVTQFGPMWVLGMPFFRKYYTTFDLDPQIGRSVFMSHATPLCTPGTNTTMQPTSLLGFTDGAPREASADPQRALISPFVRRAIRQKRFSI